MKSPTHSYFLVVAALYLPIFGVSLTPTLPSYQRSRSVATRRYASRQNIIRKNGSASSSLSPSQASNPMESMMKMILPGQKPNTMVSGIEAALMLTDKKRQEDWKIEMRQQFPLVPAVAFDICIDSLSEGFSSMAPAQLKAALRPGGLEKVRPGLEDTIVTNLEQQQVMKSIPLKANDKRQLLQYVVSKSLDYMLKDAELLLAEPAVKLQVLESQKQNIQRYMTFWQLSWYRIRYYPVQMTVLGLLSIYASYSLYQQTKHTWVIANIVGLLGSISSHLQLLVMKVCKFMGLGTTKAVKRKAIRRLVVKR